MARIFTTSNLFDQFKFIFEEKNERVEEVISADIAILPYSYEHELLEKIEKCPILFLAVNSDDLEIFEKIPSSNLNLKIKKSENGNELLLIGEIGIEPSDEIIKTQKSLEIGLKRNDKIYSYIYLTEIHRKLRVGEVKNLLELYIRELCVNSTEKQKGYNKKTWSSIQRSLNFLFAFNNPVEISHFLRLAEITDLEGWVTDYIKLGILQESDNHIALTKNAKEVLIKASKEWPNLAAILEGVFDG